MDEINHGRRFTIIWAVCTIIAVPLVIWVLGPNLGYGEASNAGEDQATTLTVLAAIATPFLLLVGLYLVYAAMFFRQPRGQMLEGPAVRDDAKVQISWIVVTSITVLILAVYGSVALIQNYGDGTGSGASPLNRPSHVGLRVQVIGQQWTWTYRWPEYGGVETPGIEIPVNTMIEFNVTSLDVIHSWTVKELGIKADANPQVNNIAFAEPNRLLSFEYRCTELCGIWHGAMYGFGRVVTRPQFEEWIHKMQIKYRPAEKYLPPFALTYQPKFGSHRAGFEEES
ncbi:MAG TPA: cytochrome c oxidase subunit II [Solirubrobacteraceae bacterium]|nr:cytochrome c oxidase subunit II [Solirubrobacteraceae bacterium]